MGKLSFNNNMSSEIVKIIFLALFLAALCFGQTAKTPHTFGAEVVKFKDIKLLQKRASHGFAKDISNQNFESINRPLSGYTFKAVAFDEERGIEKFTKQSANTFLERDLFSAPEYTATYYYSKYDKNSLNVESIYIQLVSDSHWDRILFGSLQGVLKSYDGIKNPGEIVVNSAGQVFIAERGKSRIQVLQINGKNEEISLDYLYAIEKVGEISSIAYNDAGTPFDLTDDFLFSADAASNIITRINLSGNSGIKGVQYKGFKWPVAIAFGRWNGANTNDLYVIDSYAKKLSLYQVDANDLALISEIQANHAQTFSAVEVDHFGQIYLADGVNSELFKYTADLQLLDSKKAQDTNINDINIPFGTVDLNGEKYWTGFDQAFVIQKWKDDSGVQRYKLGVALKAFSISISENNETLKTDYKLTEFANSNLQIVDANGNTIYQSDEVTVASGKNSMSWNRISKNNQQVSAGNYKMKLEIQSVYDESIISKEASFFLPLYYHINCGEEDVTQAIQKISGIPNVINGQSVLESSESVEYKLVGLNPDSEYKIAARFLNAANEERVQEIIVDGLAIGQSFKVTNSNNHSGYIEIPQEAYLDGEIRIQVKRVGVGNVNVADIWLTESGQEFSFGTPQEALPTTYELSQNYPNPFNPSTTISYQLTASGDVVLKVYDVTGREIVTLVNGYQNAGKYDMIFDAGNLSSGIYFYKLTTNVFTQTRKMVLLK